MALFTLFKRTTRIPEGYAINKVCTDLECMQYMSEQAIKGNKITVMNKIEVGEAEEGWKVVVSLMGKDS